MVLSQNRKLSTCKCNFRNIVYIQDDPALQATMHKQYLSLWWSEEYGCHPHQNTPPSLLASSDEAAGLMTRSSNGIYAPKATLQKVPSVEATKMQRRQCETNYSDKIGSYSTLRSLSNSPATSSSAHTNIASPA